MVDLMSATPRSTTLVISIDSNRNTVNSIAADQADLCSLSECESRENALPLMCLRSRMDSRRRSDRAGMPTGDWPVGCEQGKLLITKAESNE